MKEKLQHYQKWALHFVHQLNDVRFLGQVLFGVLVLLISWSGVKVIQANYNLQKQISALEQQNNVQKLSNENLRLQNQYYNTNQYLELSARQNFSLANPGEKEILVPKSVALANTIEVKDTQLAEKSELKQSKYQHNIQAWLDFFFHRQSAVD